MSLQRVMSPISHPGLARHAEERAKNMQNRIADAITAFAGTMWFAYLHVLWFVIWLTLQPFGDKFPFGLLTMIVSLEAIFLSTFVMISQNRADEKRQMIASAEWMLVQQEAKDDQELLEISRQLLALTQETKDVSAAVHAIISGRPHVDP